MASVLQRGKKKKWYPVFRDLKGRQQWKPLDALDRKKAQAAADFLEATAQKKKSARYLRKAFADLYREFYGQSMSTTTLQHYVQRWLAQKKPEVAESTYESYDQVVSRFQEFLKERADEDLADVTRD